MSYSQEICIGHVKVSPQSPPFIIAEMSGNHNQSLERALRIVDEAAKAGAHALKLQTYTADTMTLAVKSNEFLISDEESLWTGKSLHDLYKEAHTPWEWHQAIFDRCKSQGLICFSSPFDETAVDFLEGLNVPAYKIASFENTDLPLIRKVAATGKPLIISTGMATLAELDEAIRTAKDSGCRELILLKCTSTYPASPKNTNLHSIPSMRQTFDLQVGLSDHTMGVGVAIASVALGATVIEKHFTLNRADGGVDSSFSIEPDELSLLVEESKRAWEALGAIHYGPMGKEKASLQYRRSLYIAEDINQGDRLTSKNLRIVRPGLGLPPKFFDLVLGKRVNRDLKKGSPVQWEIFD